MRPSRPGTPRRRRLPERRVLRGALAVVVVSSALFSLSVGSGGAGSAEAPPVKAPVKAPAAARDGAEAARVVVGGAVGVTGMPYVCVTLDWWPGEKVDWGAATWGRSTVTTLGLEDGSRFAALALALAALQPAALRVGGSLQDGIAYDFGQATSRRPPFEVCGPFRARDGDRVAFDGGCLTGAAYERLDDLALAARAPLVFGLSGLHGRTRTSDLCPKCPGPPCDPCWDDGRWDPLAGGARFLLERAAARAAANGSALAALSLGNELCGAGGLAAHLSPEALGRDFAALSAEVDRLWGPRRPGAPAALRLPPLAANHRPLVVGPDCQLPLDLVVGFYKRFRREAGDALDAVAFHLYWLGSGEKHRSIRNKIFDRAPGAAWPLARGFRTFVDAYFRASQGGEVPVWVTESGGAYGSGAARVTDTYASAFWYLDELGELAKASTALHCRQALVGGHYGLLTDAFSPRPDFFATRLWASLMGRIALDAGLDEPLANARVYAHCRLGSTAGGVVLLVVNAATSRPLDLALPPVFAAARREAWVAGAPRDAQGKRSLFGGAVAINGAVPAAADAPLPPVIAEPGGRLAVAAASYAFVAFDTAWPACL